MDLVLNEWIIHDLSGENGPRRQDEAVRFLEVLVEKCDRIVVLQTSAWMRKAYRMMKQTDPLIRELSRLLHQEVLRNPQKSRVLNPSEIPPIPQILLDPVPEDDRYLIQTYLGGPADVLVTGDERLRNALSDKPDIRIRLRDDFLREYFREMSQD